MCVYLQWASAKGIKFCTEKLPLESLDVSLAEIFCWNSLKNGQDYEWNSLAAMQASLDKHLKEYDIYSLLTNRDFSTSQTTLEGKAILISEEKFGKRPNKNCSLSKDKVWECGQFGCYSPLLLINVQR